MIRVSGMLNLSLDQVFEWSNLTTAACLAARGKHARVAVAGFEILWADHLLTLQDELRCGTYVPGDYAHFYIHEPKRRKISAAPFRDRVVHHALCQVIEPWFERRFIADSFANRKGKGTHQAVDRLQYFARRYRYVLRLDIVKHFPSIDHAILRNQFAHAPFDKPLLALCVDILASGAGVLDDESEPVFFPQDDLLSLLRPKGLPIGNLTSQFWSNVYLNPLDQFIKRELRCQGYLRYVDDMALFHDSKKQLWEWKHAVDERLQSLRLRVHESSAQPSPVTHGIPWLGFIVYPSHRLLKARNRHKAGRKIAAVWQDYVDGKVTFAELDAVVKGWFNYLRYADTWHLRKALVSGFR